MKVFVIGLLATILLHAGCASPAERSGGNREAVIRAIRGSANVSASNGDWKRAREGQSIRAGATVQTDAQSSVDFHLGEAGGVLTLHPDSTLTFEKIALGDEVAAVLNLTRGRITGDTLKLPDRRKIVVKTLGGVHEIR